MNEISIEQVDPSRYDVIIAGSGAGGLLSALGLSAEGNRVLVLEKGHHLGGVWYGYHVDGYRVDHGLHVITRVKRGAFARYLTKYLKPPPRFVLHEGWYFQVYDKVGTIPSSIGQALRWPLTGMRGRLALVKIGAKIKTMKLDEMRKHKDESFLAFMESRGATNPVMLDVMQSAIYMAAGVPINEASAYEALRTLRDTDKEMTRLVSLKKLLLGSEEYDEGVAVGGMEGLVQKVAETINGDYVLNAPVERIVETEGRVSSVTALDTELPHSKVVSNIPLSAMPSIVDSQQAQVVQFFEKWSHMKPTRGITLWLGLDKAVIGDLKSRVIVYPGPNRWL